MSNPCRRLDRPSCPSFQIRPGMYTIKHAAEMVGVSVATMRAWQRRYGVVSPRRSAGGYRLYETGDIATLRRMRALVVSGWSPKEAAEAVLFQELQNEVEQGQQRADLSPDVSDSLPSAPSDLVAAAAAMDSIGVSRLLDERFAVGSFEHVVDEWLLPELERLGTAWAAGAVSVAGEHLVASAVQRRLNAAFDAAGVANAGAPLLLAGLAAGCRHELGILAFATAARRGGFTVVYLGADLPLADWLRAAERHRPDAVVLAVPARADVVSTVEVVKALTGHRVLVAVGGAHQNAAVESVQSSPDRYAISLGHSIARGVIDLRGRLTSAST